MLLHRKTPMPRIVKKYSNRRLYDTDESRYITLEELTEKIRSGADVRVVDAKTGDDLTQATLTQIILETPAARLLPVPLLSRLIRMQDDTLGEFFSQYVSAALDLYLQAKQGAQAMTPYFPFASVPFAATNAFARLFTGGGHAPEPPPPPPPARRERTRPEATEAARDSDVQALRRELDELKREMRRRR
jgi:polyhydroxyalkanoate synthesis repressor PhaR